MIIAFKLLLNIFPVEEAAESLLCVNEEEEEVCFFLLLKQI